MLDWVHVADHLAVRTIPALFFSNEGQQPPHIHVQRERMLAKFWLEPVRLASSTGFAPQELHRIANVVTEHEAALLDAWNEYFAN